LYWIEADCYKLGFLVWKQVENSQLVGRHRYTEEKQENVQATSNFFFSILFQSIVYYENH